MTALPERPNLAYLKKRAKQLLASCREDDSKSIEFVQSKLPLDRKEVSKNEGLQLADVQHAIAREYECQSWPKLTRQVQQIASQETLPEKREQRIEKLFLLIREERWLEIKHYLEQDRSLLDVPEPNGGFRPLTYAIDQQRLSSARMLLEMGAQADPPNVKSSHTPLSWAITTGYRKAARLLIEAGAKPDLYCAAGLGMLDSVKEFFNEKGELIPGSCRFGSSRYDANGKILPKPPAQAEERISDALYMACRNGHLDTARFLLQQGADPNFRAYMGGTALHWAYGEGSRELIELLVANGADPLKTDEVYRLPPSEFGIRRSIEWNIPSLLKNIREGFPQLFENSAALSKWRELAGKQEKAKELLKFLDE